MERTKKVSIRGKSLGTTQPLICTPLVGSDTDQIMSEVAKIRPKEPDMVEWRADFFKHLGNTTAVIETASRIREALGQIPLLFTIRSEKEGGQPISLTEKEKIQLYAKICESGIIDLIDCELFHDDEELLYLHQVSRDHDVRLILSYHDFHLTPSHEEILNKLMKAESYGADVAKVAVMPTSTDDVLALLKATQDAHKQMNIPIITISMGELGALTRMIGWFFGSSVTFAVGENHSAPGQIPIDDLKTVLKIIQRSAGV